MSDDNILQFPNRHKEVKISKENINIHYETIAYKAMDDIMHTLTNNGYHPLENLLIVKDMGVLVNMLVAIMYRADGKKHFLHEPMDEIQQVIALVKKVNDEKRKILFTNDEE